MGVLGDVLQVLILSDGIVRVLARLAQGVEGTGTGTGTVVEQVLRLVESVG